MAKKQKTTETVSLEISKLDVVEINKAVDAIIANENKQEEIWLSNDRMHLAALVEKQAFLQTLHPKFSPKLYEGTSLGGDGNTQKYLRKALNTIQSMEHGGETGIKAFNIFTDEALPTSVSSFLSKWQRRDRPEAETAEPKEETEQDPADLDLAAEVEALVDRHKISLGELIEFIEDHLTTSHDPAEVLKAAGDLRTAYIA